MSDIAAKTLGYVNAKPCQLSLPPPDSHSSPMYITEGSPVTTPDGYLTGFQAKLERYVSNGMLKRILRDDPRFSQWDKMLDIRRKRTVHPVRPLEREVVGGKLPTATISSKTGITYEPREESRVVQKNQPPARPAGTVKVEAKKDIVETVAKKRRGRPPKAVAAVKPSAPAPVSATAIAEIDGKFYVGEREFDSRLAAETALRVSQL